ncbi:glycosyltransferase family 2 protein [Spirosoma aureum]|uniref:Glycosyltransferase family 2 protein n=1 Tax=Spirosoma aureum TaxID=2692134 RepID=A0A6G9ATV7_9BACT|nr:glycosyltransferase family 2 protein [Spirosoma aureum]QIP15922.1 glycosyltransferase family 2 protein [Spirosoma aureum]
MRTEVNHLLDYPILFPAPPSPLLQLSVIVPVRNEAHHLTQTLDALRNQQDAMGTPLNPAIYEVLLLANNCTDQSYTVANRYQQKYPHFPLHIAQIELPAARATIGTVRRLLMDEAHRRLTSISHSFGIIASTDGDTVVDSRWIYYIMIEIANGNDAVGGRILTHPDPGKVRLYHLRDVMYRTLVAKTEALLDPSPHDPWPRHFQHFGASIAVTCRMYEQAGRLPEKPFLEDEAFYKALLRRDARVRQSPAVKVFTSTRMDGRVAVGFSEQLRYWADLNQAGKQQIVEPVDAIITKFQNRQKLRVCWQNRQQSLCMNALAQIALDLRLDVNWLHDEIRGNSFFGQLWERIEEKMAQGDWAKHWPLVPITTAIQHLRHFCKSYTSY